jgi:hypothetical protein
MNCYRASTGTAGRQIRIDHGYLHGQVACTTAALLSPAGSDHRPIRAELVWAAKLQSFIRNSPREDRSNRSGA